MVFRLLHLKGGQVRQFEDWKELRTQNKQILVAAMDNSCDKGKLNMDWMSLSALNGDTPIAIVDCDIANTDNSKICKRLIGSKDTTPVLRWFRHLKDKKGVNFGSVPRSDAQAAMMKKSIAPIMEKLGSWVTQQKKKKRVEL